jgi:hypothetical protein
MNDGTRVTRGPRRTWSLITRAAAAIIATAAPALLAAACSNGSPSPAGSGDSPTAGDSASSPSAVAFSSCMRSHGVPTYPDPDSNGTLPKPDAQAFGVSSSRLNSAQVACQHLLPTVGGSLTASSLQQCYLAGVCPQALVQRAVSEGLKFARCMRSHGVPSWPDPTIDSHGRPLFNIRVPRPAPPRVSTAINQCERLEHAGSLLAWG